MKKIIVYYILPADGSGGQDKCDSGVVGNARPCQGRDRGFEPRLSLRGTLVFQGFFDFFY